MDMPDIERFDVNTVSRSPSYNVTAMYSVHSDYSAHSVSPGVDLSISYPTIGATSVIRVGKLSQKYRELVNKHEWVVSLFSSYNSISSVSDLAPYYKKLGKLLRGGAYNDVDTLIESLDVASCSSLFLIGLPRFTYQYRTKLSSWQHFAEAAVAEARNRNIDERAYSGLV
jgi:hypothetical protein